MKSDKSKWKKLRAIAEEATRRHPKIKDAARFVMSKLDRDEPLRLAVFERLFELGVYKLIYEERHEAAAIIKQTPGHCRRTPEAMAESAAVAQQSLYEWPMPDGRVLGDWKGGELLPVAQQADAQARGIAQRASLFYWLSVRVPKDKTVRSCVPLADLNSAWKRISGGRARDVTQIAVAAAQHKPSDQYGYEPQTEVVASAVA